MNDERRLTIDVQDKKIRAVLADGDLWLSQGSLARIYHTSAQNINMHLAKLAKHINIASSSKCFSSAQREGQRSVSRKLRHYNLEIAHAIGLRAQRFSELNLLIQIAEGYGVLKSCYRIVPVQERDFAEMLILALNGITRVVRQFHVLSYYIDFYLPDCSLAVEYDESHHFKILQKNVDKKRQTKIKEMLGVRFIRVREGQELLGLNRIVKHIIQHNSRMTRKNAGLDSD